MVNKTLKEKNEFCDKMSDKYKGSDYMPEDIKKKYLKYGKEIVDNSQKNVTELVKMFKDKKISLDFFKKYANKFRDFEIFSLDEIPELKKAESESDKENKKPLTVTQQNNLIRKIPDDMFTREEILKIVEHIRNGTMTKASQMPNPTKKEPKVPLDAVVLDKKKKIKGGALKAVVKQGRPKKIKTEEQIKAEEKAKADKLKAKEAKLKPYFKIGEIPKGFRRASMLEAKEAGKINYWGIKQVDNKILTLTEETDPKKIKAKIAEKTIKLGGLMGKFSKIKKDIVIAKNKNDNKAEVKLNAELDELKKVILQSNNELTTLKDKLKKRSGTGLPSTNTDDDADSDTDNIAE